MAYVAQQQLDGYDATIRHAIKRKVTFDKWVLARSPREVIFNEGQLVQFFHSNLHNTLEACQKLLPKWSVPYRIKERLHNLYRLETLEGEPMAGEFHARRLWAFIPRNGTKLAEEQREREIRGGRREEDDEQGKEDIPEQEENEADNHDDESEEEGEGEEETEEMHREAE